MSDFKIIEHSVKGKICVIVGTRPGIIKMSPIIKELEERKANFFVVHAGQHYSYNMDRKFFEDLELSKPRYKLEKVKNYSLHGEQTAEMLKGIERVLIEEKPEVVLVCGDANVNLAGALAARKLQLKVGHVEAGLRSNNWRMPEEHNRVIIDHISDYLFVPNEKAKHNALKDNVKGKVFVTGSTIVDALMQIKGIAQKKSNILKDLNLEAGKYFLLTAHREENVDIRDCLEGIIKGVRLTSDKYGIPIIYPIHPRTKKRIQQFELEDIVSGIENLLLIDPLGYIDFTLLLSKAKLVLTDSGGVQQEACILRTPCITLRPETEWVETVEARANFVAGVGPHNIIEGVGKLLAKSKNWKNPFSEGGTAKKIVTILESLASGE